jgi:LacI family transcriptional regulator, kdg operon repressor
MPLDLGLVGSNELEWSSLVSPGITTIAQPSNEIGVAAVRDLVARVEGAHIEPQRTIFPGTLIERRSSHGTLGPDKIASTDASMRHAV